MEKFIIKGPPKRAIGEIICSGAKNSALPLMASSILFDDEIVLKNVPLCGDVYTMQKLLTSLGSTVKIQEKNNVIKIHNKKKLKAKLPYDAVKKMRGSLLLMGPLLGKYKKCKTSRPGGCLIGFRGIGWHLNGFSKLGASHEMEKGYINLKAKKLHGGTYRFPKVSVTGTSNLIMASVLLEQKKIQLRNISLEPECLDLILWLKKCGARIFFTGYRSITIEGVKKLTAKTHEVCPDRIEAFSYLCVGAITRGHVKVNKINPIFLREELNILRKIGCRLKTTSNSIEIKVNNKLKSAKIKTSVAPGLATDNQPMFMTLLTLAKGKSEIIENIFSNRIANCAQELNRMNASIAVKKNRAIIIGKDRLKPADVMASDLRCGFALILGAIAARDNKNASCISRVYHVRRSYYKIISKLKKLGINIKSIS